jgi:hypothetical protein
MRFFAQFFSYVFHPLLMVTYFCLLIFFGMNESMFYMFTPIKVKLILTIIVFVFTFLIPLLNLFILVKLKYVSSLHIEERTQRTFPLLATAFCYFGLYYMLSDFSIWPFFKLFILASSISILVASIINYWWKISTHMIGIGGITGVLIIIGIYMQIPIFNILSISFVIAGIVGFSRLKLSAHNSSQIYSGFLVGISIQTILFYLAHQIQLL